MASDGNEPATSGTYSFEAVANRVGAFVIVYDPYHVETARREIAKFDTTRMVDAPEAKVIVLIPNMRQHTESGSFVDLDVLRVGVDVVGLFDSDSARRVGRALNGTGVRVVLLPAPKMRDVMNYEQLSEQQKLPSMAAALQTMFDLTLADAKAVAADLYEENQERKAQNEGNRNDSH